MVKEIAQNGNLANSQRIHNNDELFHFTVSSVFLKVQAYYYDQLLSPTRALSGEHHS